MEIVVLDIPKTSMEKNWATHEQEIHTESVQWSMLSKITRVIARAHRFSMEMPNLQFAATYPQILTVKQL